MDTKYIIYVSMFIIIVGLTIALIVTSLSKNDCDPNIEQLSPPDADPESFLVRSIPETELITQFHGNPMTADLVLFMAGNQFVCMDLLVSKFKELYPEVKNVFYVTIPPGQELRWILDGGITIVSNTSVAPIEIDGFQLTVAPDVFTTVNKGHMDQLASQNIITRHYTYIHNRLVLMASRLALEDPQSILNQYVQQDGDGYFLSDGNAFYQLMANNSVKISEPDIITQGIERWWWRLYTEATKVKFQIDSAGLPQSALDEIENLNIKGPIGPSEEQFYVSGLSGDVDQSLRKIVYYDKACDGINRPDLTVDDPLNPNNPANSGCDPETLITLIHHLETPDNIRAGRADVGTVWSTEVAYQLERKQTNEFAAIEIRGLGPDNEPLNQKTKVNYLATITEGVMTQSHKGAAKAWMSFLRSEEAQLIMQTNGFDPATPEELSTPTLTSTSNPGFQVCSY